MAILGEIPYHEGTRLVNAGKLAYVESEPYIFPASIRDNIIFELPFEMELYEKVIKLCSLDVDLNEMPQGDETEIGERG